MAAEAHARAAQILAEMLGMVCHREYYRYGTQMVSPIFPPQTKFSNSKIGICHSNSRFESRDLLGGISSIVSGDYSNTESLKCKFLSRNAFATYTSEISSASRAV